MTMQVTPSESAGVLTVKLIASVYGLNFSHTTVASNGFHLAFLTGSKVTRLEAKLLGNERSIPTLSRVVLSR
jgi:hypothetical protein